MPHRPRRGHELLTSLRQRVQVGLHLGVLRFGDRLPSARELALEFDTDPRAALAAYRALERQGIVTMRSRSGTYVAAPEEFAPSLAEGGSPWLIEILAQGIASGISPMDFSEHIRSSMETLRLRAIVLEGNDDQLFSVSDELARDYGFEVFAIDTGVAASGDDIPSEARKADCIITTGLHGARARRIAKRLRIPIVTVKMCDDLFAEVERLLRHQSVYFVVADPRFQRKLESMIQSSSHEHRLHVMALPTAELDSIPPDAPTYLTRLARQKVSAPALLERVLPEARVFSDASCRELLQLVVESNLAVLRKKREVLDIHLR